MQHYYQKSRGLQIFSIPKFITVCLAALIFVANGQKAHAMDLPLTVTWDSPNPSQNGINRAAGDGDEWSFTLQLEGVVIVGTPVWHYPTKTGGADPAWGLWNEGATSLSWSGSDITSAFSVSVSGRIRKAGGGGTGGAGGDPEEKDFEADWSGDAHAGKTWTTGSGIGQHKDAGGNLVDDGRMTGPQDQTRPPAEWKKVYAGPGDSVICGVESATDNDHWTRGTDQGDESETVSYTWSCAGGGFLVPDGHGGQTTAGTATGTSATWKAPTTGGVRCEITCTLDDPWLDGQTPPATGVSDPEDGTRNDGSVVRTATIDVWSAEISAKRIPLPDSDYAESATVAAGAVGDAAHQAKVVITLKDADGIPIPGIAGRAPVVVSGGKGPEANTVSATLHIDDTPSDAAGKIYGTFTAGSRTENTVIRLPYDLTNPNASGPTTTIAQVWNQLGDGAWAFNPIFDYDERSSTIYTMEYPDHVQQVRITGHAMEFVTTAISGYAWNPDGGDDLDGDGLADGSYEPEVYSPVDTDLSGWDQWSALSWFDAITEDNGVYSADQIVYWDDDFIVDYVSFDIIDNASFDENGSEDE